MPENIAHYTVLERLGGGTLGDVYRARDTKVGRTVALIVPSPDLIPDAARQERFVEDARAAGTLNHPNIAALFDVIEQDGRWYLAYEFAAGPSLRQEMSGLRLGVRRAVDLAAQIADALAEGHSRGIVHGGLSPETVVVTPKGSTKILNFGMVQWTTASADASLPDHAASAYLSPEQARGEPIDARSDLFALGVMLHEMLTGKPPVTVAVAASVRGKPAPASLQNSGVPPELDALLARAMSQDAGTRYQSAATLGSDLRAVAVVLDSRSGDSGAAVERPRAEPGGFASGGRWAAAALGAALLVAWWLWR